MSLAAKAFYNQLVAERMADPLFRIELIEHYYLINLTIAPTCVRGKTPVSEISQELKDIVAFVNESDFTIVVNKYKEIFGPKTEDEVFTDKFIKMLDKYQIPVKSTPILDKIEAWKDEQTRQDFIKKALTLK